MKINRLIIFCFLGIFFTFNIFSEEKDKFRYDEKGKRDPFFKVEVPLPDEICSKCGKKYENCICEDKDPIVEIKELGLLPNAIMMGDGDPAILVGDDILGIGDAKGPIIVRDIDKSYVVYEFKGELVEIAISIIKE